MDDLLEIPPFLKRKASRKKIIEANTNISSTREIIWDLKGWASKKKTKVVVKPETNTAPKLTIQQRIAEQVSEYIAELEDQVDSFMEGYSSKFDMYKWLMKNNIKSPQAGKIAEYYTPILNEYVSVLSKEDDQLNEAYSFMTKAQVLKAQEFFQMIVDDATRWSTNLKKSVKPRKKRQRSVDQILKHFKFKQSDPDFKVQSIDPAKIIGAKELWVLHTGFVKKIGVYRALDRGGFTIDRSSIKNFDTDTSVEKRIGRNPEDVVAKVLEGGKITLRKLTDSLRASNEEPTGRINKNIVLLKVIK